MADLYTIDEGASVYWQPVPEFDTSNDAETFAATHGTQAPLYCAVHG